MATNKFRTFPVGAQVVVEDPFLFGGAIHEGTVVAVKFEKNGYPTTQVDFPTKGGVRVWAVECLLTADELEARRQERKQLFPHSRENAAAAE